MKFSFHPKLLDTLPGYDRAAFLQDLSSGITVGVLALPLAMAFAIASGMSPAAGIWTAIVAGFLTSLLGGSRVQIAGPTGAFIPILYAIVANLGIHDLLVATMLSGVMLFAMGAFKLGGMIRFIPLTVVIGFTNGIAVIIFLSQIKDFFGLPIKELPAEFFAKFQIIATSLPGLDPVTLAFAIASVAILLAWNFKAAATPWMQRLPGPLAVLIIATLVNTLFDLPIDTIGSRFDGIPQGLPDVGFPEINLSTLGKLISPALALALLGAIESLLAARVADSMIDDRHNPNQELMAQGIANFVAPLFGGFASTGAMARTATNVKSGGRSPVAGCVHAICLLAIVLVLAPLTRNLPLATLSAIVMVVAVNMGKWQAFAPRELARYSNNYRLILLTTFFITVIFDLTLAVELGMVMSALFFITRMAALTRIEPIALDAASESPAIRAWHLSGSLFFGAANKLEALLDATDEHTQIAILDFSRVLNIDTTALDILQTLHRSLQKRGATLILCGLNPQPLSLFTRSGFVDQVGADIQPDFAKALERAWQVHRGVAATPPEPVPLAQENQGE
ncbi:MAG: STAS domain-containing protein [Azoarcus sp.]|jgi:SulP family sulfate permease|nr:STAS domain-containing protein [Azoarcus sp.]